MGSQMKDLPNLTKLFKTIEKNKGPDKALLDECAKIISELASEVATFRYFRALEAMREEAAKALKDD